MTAIPTLVSGAKAHVLTNEERSKGGKTVTREKRLSLLTHNSRRAKCGNCKAMCILKNSNPKSCICPIPEARAKAIFYDSPVMDKGILLKLSHETLLKIQNAAKTQKDLKMLHSAYMDQLKTEHPEVQKSINLHGINEEIVIRWGKKEEDGAEGNT